MRETVDATMSGYTYNDSVLAEAIRGREWQSYKHTNRQRTEFICQVKNKR